MSKILLIGRENAGKTEMRMCILGGLSSLNILTEGIEKVQLELPGNQYLELWDFKGIDIQKGTSLSDENFKDTVMMIYVFDATSQEKDMDTHFYQSCLEKILANSPEAKIVCLIHKMDSVHLKRDMAVKNFENDLRHHSVPCEPEIFKTSVWNESINEAWSKIYQNLTPSIDIYQNFLNQASSACEAAEIILLERKSYLVIARTQKLRGFDDKRFEKLPSIIRSLERGKSGRKLVEFDYERAGQTILIRTFTPHMYIIFVTNQPRTIAAQHIKAIEKSFKECCLDRNRHNQETSSSTSCFDAKS